MGQSTNDVFPAATRIALLAATTGLIAAARELARALQEKAARSRMSSRPAARICRTRCR